MADVKLKIKADGYEAHVLKFDYEMDRGTEKSGRPSTPPMGGTLSLTVKTPTERPEKYFAAWLASWNVEQEKSRDGVLEIRETATDPAPFRTISFTGGQIIFLKEEFDEFQEGGHGLIRIVKITAKDIIVDTDSPDPECKFSKHWA